MSDTTATRKAPFGWRRFPARGGARRNARLRFRTPHRDGGPCADDRLGEAGAKSPAPDAGIESEP